MHSANRISKDIQVKKVPTNYSFRFEFPNSLTASNLHLYVSSYHKLFSIRLTSEKVLTMLKDYRLNKKTTSQYKEFDVHLRRTVISYEKWKIIVLKYFRVLFSV